MEAFDKVEELLLAEGYSKEEIPAIMVSLVEQGMSPTEIVGRGIIDMLNLLPKKRKPEPLPKTKAVADLLPDTQQPKAPKPEFGSNAAKPQTRVKPELRPGGRTPEPQFRVTQPTNNVTPRRNNLSLQRTNLRAPSIPAPPVSKPSLFSRIRGAGASLAAQTAGIELATKLAQSAGRPGQSRMSMFGAERGDAPVYNTPLSPNNVADAKASGYVPKKGFLDTIRNPSPQPKSPSLTQQQVNRDNQRYGNTVPSGSFGISQQGRAQAAANRAAVQPKVAPTPPAPTPTPAPPVPKLTTAQQAVNTEYDRLRKSDPAAAVRYGLRMARAGASKRSFTMPK